MDELRPIVDQNVARLLQHAYEPESPDPDFVAGLQQRLRSMAQDQAFRQTEEARMSRIRTRMAAFMAVVAACTAIALFAYAQRTGPVRRGVPPIVPAEHQANEVRKRDSAAGMTAQPAPVAAPLRKLEVGGSLATAAHEIQRVMLPDGSRIAMNVQSSIRLEANRRIVLERGEIFVEVEPAAERFLVKTPDREVVALGTKFAVRHHRDKTGVVVSQGKVQVSGIDGILHAGQQLLPDATGAVDAPRVSASLDWARDLLAGSPLVPGSKFTGGALVAIDRLGQEAKITLDRFHLDVHIEDGFARTTIDQTYFNHDYNQLEGTFYFPLPADASISRLAMYVNGVLMEGGMAERNHARNTFETIRHTRRDPALLEWMDGSTFKMRVFPLEPRQEKRIILSYSQRLPNVHGKADYRFPLGHNLPIVKDWSVFVRAKGAAHLPWACSTHLLEGKIDGNDLTLTAHAKNIKPARDLQLELTDAGANAASIRFASTLHDGKRYVGLRYRPQFAAGANKRRSHYTVLFESAADRDPLLARAQIEVVRTLLENLEHEHTFAILAAGTHCKWVQAEPVAATKKNIDAAIEKLESVHLIGALDLGLAFDTVAPILKETKDSCIVHVGSGIQVLGERKEDALLAKLPATAKYAGIGIGKRWNRTLMKAAAERSDGHFVQIQPDEPVTWRTFEFLSALDAPRLHNVRVTDDAGREWLMHDASIAAGDELSAITAHAAGDAAPKKVVVTGRVSGKLFEQSISIEATSDGKYLPRTWGKLEIDRMVTLGSEKNKAAIIDLSKRLYVMSPFTSLLVLENDAMYSQFNIDRGRQDHWARYEAPAQVPVVKDVAGPPAPMSSMEQVLRSIVVRRANRPLSAVGAPIGSKTVWDLQGVAFNGWGAQVWDDGVSNNVWFEQTGDMKNLFTNPAFEGIDDSIRKKSGAVRLNLIRPLTTDLPAQAGDLVELERQRSVQGGGQSAPNGKSLSPGAGFGKGSGRGGGGFGGGGFGGQLGFGNSGFGGQGGFGNSGFGGQGGFGGLGGFGGQGGFPGGFPGGGPMAPGMPFGPGGPPGGGTGMPGMPGMPGIPGMTGGPGPMLVPGKILQDELRELDRKALFHELDGRKLDFETIVDGIQRQRLLANRYSFAIVPSTEVGRDLLAFAPGMDTVHADVLAALAKEAKLELSPGEVEPAARRLVEQARAIGWHRRTTSNGVSIIVDGAGRCVIERTLPSALRERIVCDGSVLFHLYPELGVGARRWFSRFHLDDLREFAPWLLPTADDLARGRDLKTVGPRTVALSPRGATGPHLEHWLDFGDDGRLTERRIMSMPEKKQVHSIKYSNDDYGQPAEAPSLQPDLQRLVVLPLPYRTAEYANEWKKRFGNISLFKGHAQLLEVTTGLASMTNSLQHAGVGMVSGDRQCWNGALTVLRAANMLARAGTAANENAPIGRYWQWWTQGGVKKTAEIQTNGSEDGLFLQRLADLAYMLQEPKLAMSDHMRRLRKLVASRQDEFALAALVHCAARPEMNVDHWMALAEQWWLMAQNPSFGYLARYERMRCLSRAQLHVAARQAFAQLCDYAIEKDLPLSFDGTIESLRSTDAKWHLPLVKTAKAWVAKAPDRVLWLAMQCKAFGQSAAADAIFEVLRPELKSVAPPIRLAAAYYSQAGDPAFAQALLQPLLEDESLKKSPAVWRLAAEIAKHRRHTKRFAEALDRALDLEFAVLPDAIDVQQLRGDYGALLEAYRQLMDALKQTEGDLPADMQARIVRAADRWRSLDPDVTTVCFTTARLMREMESPDLAWEYVTSPLATRPNDADSLRKLAAELSDAAQLELAERAYGAAFAVEPTDAQLLWDRALVLQRLNRNEDARAIFKQIAEGQWQPRFENLRQQAANLMRH